MLAALTAAHPTLPSPRAPSVGRVRRAVLRRTPRGPAEPRVNSDAPALTVWGDDQASALTDAVADIPHDEWLALGRALLARGLSEEEQRARARVDALCAAHRLAYTAWLVRDAIETGEYLGRGRQRRPASHWAAWRTRRATCAARAAAREAAAYAALAVLLRRRLPGADVRRLRSAFDASRRRPERPASRLVAGPARA